MGKILRKIAELGIERNTIVIFTSDNGPWMPPVGSKGPWKRRYNGGMRGKKGSYYDGGHRVPCFVRYPDGGLTGGRDVDTLTDHVDLLPTLIDLCHLKSPRDVKFDGVSIASLLSGAAEGWPDRTLFVQYRQSHDPPVKWNAAVMTQRWRLVGGTELYDIQADTGQTRNVAAEHADVVAELRARYEAWWSDVSQRFGEYSEIVLGSEAENPARLTSRSWWSRWICRM